MESKKKKLWPDWKNWLAVPKSKDCEQAKREVERARRAHFQQIARRHG